MTIDPERAHATPAIPLSAADQSSITAYLSAGDRAAVLFDIVWKVCVGLMVLILVTWALGLLPGAVRLF